MLDIIGLGSDGGGDWRLKNVHSNVSASADTVFKIHVMKISKYKRLIS
jgi:hypothetical protein